MDVIANIQKQHINGEKTDSSNEGDKMIILDYKAFIGPNKIAELSRDDFVFVIGDTVKGDESTVNLFNLFYKAKAKKDSRYL